MRSPPGPSRCRGAWWLTPLTFCFPTPWGAHESCFLGAPRSSPSSKGARWTPQDITELRRSGALSARGRGDLFIWFDLIFFVMFWIEVNTAELRCISFFLFLLMDLWQHSEINGRVQGAATKRVKKITISIEKRPPCDCELQPLPLRVVEICHRTCRSHSWCYRLADMWKHHRESLISRPEYLGVVPPLVSCSVACCN